MPVSVDVQINGTKELSVSLGRLRKTISVGSSTAIGRPLTREGLRIVRKLTPRNRSGVSRTGSTRRNFPPFRGQWEPIEQESRTSAYKAIIRNKATATREGLIALASVEFGAKAHPITPHGKYPLRWRQSTGNRYLGRSPLSLGDEVLEFSDDGRTSNNAIAWLVNHPGNAPFHMVQDTRVQMNRVANRLLINFQKKIERIFGPISISVK